MFVLTVNRFTNMPAYFLRHTISNGMLGSRFRVHVNVIINIQTEHENVLRFESRNLFKHVDLFKQQRGMNSATLLVQNNGWSK